MCTDEGLLLAPGAKGGDTEGTVPMKVYLSDENHQQYVTHIIPTKSEK
jgi:hypothetical protein